MVLGPPGLWESSRESSPFCACFPTQGVPESKKRQAVLRRPNHLGSLSSLLHPWTSLPFPRLEGSPRVGVGAIEGARISQAPGWEPRAGEDEDVRRTKTGQKEREGEEVVCSPLPPLPRSQLGLCRREGALTRVDTLRGLLCVSACLSVCVCVSCV